MSQKCQAKVKSGKQCDRDSLQSYLYCQQHIEIVCVKHLSIKSSQNIKSKLIPDLECMVMEYLTPYEYYELIGLNNSHTLETYKLHQKKYEKQISNKIVDEYNQQLRELQKEYADTLQKYKQEFKNATKDVKTDSITSIYQKYGLSITPLAKNKMELVRLRSDFLDLKVRFRELTSQKLKDANMFIFLQQDNHKFFGIDLDNTFTYPSNPIKLKKYLIIIDFDEFRISESISSGTFIHIDKKILSPLWILFRSFLDTTINLPNALPISQFS